MFVCLFNISGTNEQISKPFFSSENWETYINLEYKTNFVRFWGAEIFGKQYGVLEYTSTQSFWPEVVLTLPEWPWDILTVPCVAQTPLGRPVGATWGPLGPLRSVRNQSGHLKATLVLWGPLQVSMNVYLSLPEPRFVSLISQPPKIAQNWFCIQNLHMYLSFQKKKTV